MSDEETGEEKPFAAEIAKQGRAVCKRCKQKCLQGELRIAKLVTNPFGSGKMKTWFHLDCIFEVFKRQRQGTRRIQFKEDIDGFEQLDQADQAAILQHLKNFESLNSSKEKAKSPKKAKNVNIDLLSADSELSNSSSLREHTKEKDNLFKTFRKIVADVANASSFNSKVLIIKELLENGISGGGFKGDLYLWCRMLLPGVSKRNYNLKSKQLVKVFSKILKCSQEKIWNSSKETDISEAIRDLFEQSKEMKPAKKSTMTLQEVDETLEQLSNLTKEDQQISYIKNIMLKCTVNDLKIIIRLIKHDLRMNAGAKHMQQVLQELKDSNGDQDKEIKKCLEFLNKPKEIKTVNETSPSTSKLPILAKACKIVEPSLSETLDSEPEETILKSPLKKRRSSFIDFEISPKPDKTKKTKISETEKRKSNDLDNKNELHESNSDLFLGIKALVEDDVLENHKDLFKSFKACGGIILGKENAMEASHVIHLYGIIKQPKVVSSNNARHVVFEWIKDSIDQDGLQDFRPYTVRWHPDV